MMALDMLNILTNAAKAYRPVAVSFAQPFDDPAKIIHTTLNAFEKTSVIQRFIHIPVMQRPGDVV